MNDFEKVRQLIEAKFGSEAVVGTEISGKQPALLIHPDFIEPVAFELRDNPSLWFDFLACITAVDHGVDENRFSVVYHLSSMPYKRQLTLKVIRPFDRSTEEMPVFKSVAAVWRTAEWHEREAYDLLGVYFDQHPDLRRILLPDDWVGFPLRKDYTTAPAYKGIKIDY